MKVKMTVVVASSLLIAVAGWWLLDYIDVVVHVFGTEERAYYDLERLWSDAPRLRWGADGSADAASTAR